MLLMFGIGLHFSLQDLLSVRKIALPGATVQIAIATALGVGVAVWWDWSLAGAIVFGLARSVASTVVLLTRPDRRISFILAGVGMSLGLLPAAGQSLVGSPER